MQDESTNDAAEQRRNRNILLAVIVLVGAVALFFLVPRAFMLGRNSIDTPAQAAAQSK